MLSSLLSSLLLFSLGAFAPGFFSSPICHRTCLPCSLQVLSLLPFSLLLCCQAALERMDFLAYYISSYLPSFMQIFALGRNLLPVAFPYPRSRPYAIRLAFLLISNLSPYPLSTAMLLSESSATEKRAFLPFGFFPYLFLLSFPMPSSLVWDPRFSLSPTHV